LWGADDLPFLTPPPAPALAEARNLLASLGALDGPRITPHGRALAALPLHPRLGHMLQRAGAAAAPLAALLADRDPLRASSVDLSLRLLALRDPARFTQEHSAEVNRAAIDRIRLEAKRLAKGLPDDSVPLTAGQMAALAYPDRIGLRRKGDTPRWVLSGGKGAAMAPTDALANARLIVVTDTDGDAREAMIRQAAILTEGELRGLYADQISWRETCHWSRREGRVMARRQECYGALVLADQHWDAPPEAVAMAALEGLREIGLPWTPAAARLRARIRLASGDGWPDVSDDALLADADWLLPHLGNRRTTADLRALDLTEPLRALLSWDQMQRLDTLTPAHFETPLGRRVPIDYDGDDPGISIRLQELFGVTTHPTVGANRLPLRLTLLSPAQAPLQITRDLPGFWASSYADVRRDMRGAYPRHPWPEDPTQAEPTTRAKPRGT
ncbi:MAG: ATP-dependent helicase C-terminal domain-containing protein, partial [Paracoccaceae bacterium]